MKLENHSGDIVLVMRNFIRKVFAFIIKIFLVLFHVSAFVRYDLHLISKWMHVGRLKVKCHEPLSKSNVRAEGNCISVFITGCTFISIQNVGYLQFFISLPHVRLMQSYSHHALSCRKLFYIKWMGKIIFIEIFYLILNCVIGTGILQ